MFTQDGVHVQFGLISTAPLPPSFEYIDMRPSFFRRQECQAPTIKESVVTPELPTAATTERIADRHPPADRRRQRNCEFIGLKIAELLSQVKLIFTARSDSRLARRNAGESMGSHGTTCGQFRWRAERR